MTKAAPSAPESAFEERAAIIAEGHRVSRTEAERLARVQLGMLAEAEQPSLAGVDSRARKR